MLGIFIPEVEGTVRACCAECAVNRVDGNSVDGVDVCYVALWWVAVAFEREVKALRSQ